MSKTIIFIHGAWLAANSWDSFREYFASQGYATLVPSWPSKETSVDTLRANPPEALAHLSAEEILEHYTRIIQQQTEPPILIGHSFGGLFVQILLDRGLGAAGVAIDPAAPKGIMPPLIAFRALSGVLLTRGFWKKVVRMSFKQFQFGFVNGLPLEVQRAAYDTYVVPESGKLFSQAVNAAFDAHSPLTVNFHNATRAPLLLTAGTQDHTVPASQVTANYNKYRQTSARTDFLTFEGRTHWLIKQEGWEEVAKKIDTWLKDVGVGSTGPLPQSAEPSALPRD
ncbi:MAG TPA: alpha/beta hydrolase [Ktedonobacteraceae bacterium]|jgi:pimeloyl-ACP methyl ester carboxylesterase|nr:alpha/beta hydrolase [Ktedonobacteraceae bacterium]